MVRLDRVQRNILAEKPRVTRFPCEFDTPTIPTAASMEEEENVAPGGFGLEGGGGGGGGGGMKEMEFGGEAGGAQGAGGQGQVGLARYCPPRHPTQNPRLLS